MVETTRAFIHGLDSSSQGTKGSFFRERYPDMCMEDFNGPLEQRMAQLNNLLRGKKNLILVGSSFGGLMAALFTCNNTTLVRRLVLLAPALGRADFRPFYETPLTLPVILYHGRHDVVVDPHTTLSVAQQLFSNLESHLVDDDHNLHRVFPTLDWNTLLDLKIP